MHTQIFHSALSSFCFLHATEKHHSSYDDDEYIPILYNMYIKCWVLLSFTNCDVSRCCCSGMKNQVKIKPFFLTSTINVLLLFCMYLLLTTQLLDGGYAMSWPKTNSFFIICQKSELSTFSFFFVMLAK